MKTEVIIYSEISNPPFLLELLEGCDVLYISSNFLNKKNIKNKNILLLITQNSEITLSEYLSNNALFYQRTVEFLYPIKIVKENNKIFFSIDEKIPQECKILKKYNYLIWVQC